MPVYETAGISLKGGRSRVCSARKDSVGNMGLARVQPWDGTDGVSETAGENRVGQLRRERRMSQAAVAQCVGISRQSLNAIENGKCQPRLLVAYRLARLFQRPIENVFLLDGFDGLDCR
jgi:putative transcriptional regulator